MCKYLVEAYIASSRETDATAAGHRARTTAEEMSSVGASIRYIRTTFVPDDETCFHLFEAASLATVEEASRRAGLSSARVVPAIEASPPARRRPRERAPGD
jgi:uncharacterized protein DUF4242